MSRETERVWARASIPNQVNRVEKAGPQPANGIFSNAEARLPRRPSPPTRAKGDARGALAAIISALTARIGLCARFLR